MRSIPFSPFHDRPKASEWRWMEYSEPIPIINKPASRLYAAIKEASKIDRGTGSTFDALAARGLVQVGIRGPDGYPHLRIPPAGRKLAQVLDGQASLQGAASRHAQGVVLAGAGEGYAAGTDGVEGDAYVGGTYGNIGWNSWLRLSDYKWGALIEERASGSWHNPATGSSGSRYRIHITGAGWALYEREWARYRELYSDVDAPDPTRVDAAVGERA